MDGINMPFCLGDTHWDYAPKEKMSKAKISINESEPHFCQDCFDKMETRARKAGEIYRRSLKLS